MSDKALENANQRRNEALGRLATAKESAAQAQAMVNAARAELDKIDSFIALWHEFADVTSVPVVTSFRDERTGITIENNVPLPSRSRKATGNPKKEAVAEMSRQIILERGAPIQRTALFSAVRERGLHIKGSDPEMVFSTMLWRTPGLIVRLPDWGYWLPEEPFEPAGYVPGQTSKMIDAEEFDMQVANGTGRLPDTDEDDNGESDLAAGGGDLVEAGR